MIERRRRILDSRIKNAQDAIKYSMLIIEKISNSNEAREQVMFNPSFIRDMVQMFNDLDALHNNLDTMRWDIIEGKLRKNKTKEVK